MTPKETEQSTQPARHWHAIPIEDVLQRLDVLPARGLSDAEAARAMRPTAAFIAIQRGSTRSATQS